MVIELHYGLNGKEILQQKEVMKILGCSRGTYQKLRENALWRLSKLGNGVTKELYMALD
jgi:DNA-directed RNA polymerase specialized sigma subunit